MGCFMKITALKETLVLSFCGAVLLAFVACSDSSDSNSSGPDSRDFEASSSSVASSDSNEVDSDSSHSSEVLKSSSSVKGSISSSSISSSSVVLSSSSVHGAASSSSVVLSSASVIGTSSSFSIVRSSSSFFFFWSSSSFKAGCGDLFCGSDNQLSADEYFQRGEYLGGRWMMYNDPEEGGGSSITWPVDLDKRDGLGPVIDSCKGICGSFKLDDQGNQGRLAYDPFVSVRFYVGDFNSDSFEEGEGIDATSWAGVCITYTSDAAVALELGLSESDEYALALDIPFVSLRKCATETVAEFPWSKFKQAGWGTNVGGERMTGYEAAEKLRSLNFKIEAKTGTSGNFNIMALGKLGSCH